ncbi:MAG: type IV toxin-antitoxin system AbiEi family antitoxin domain-containing protein, partial [Pseudonocardiaceae bacterium]
MSTTRGSGRRSGTSVHFCAPTRRLSTTGTLSTGAAAGTTAGRVAVDAGVVTGDDLLASCARAQGGVFTVAQAVAAGVSHDRVRARIHRGEWRRVRGQVLCA